jgi:hypothetical protein
MPLVIVLDLRTERRYSILIRMVTSLMVSLATLETPSMLDLRDIGKVGTIGLNRRFQTRLRSISPVTPLVKVQVI